MKTSTFRWASVVATLVATGAIVTACGDDDTTNPVINPGVDAGRDSSSADGSINPVDSGGTDAADAGGDAGDAGDAGDSGDAGTVAVTLSFKAKVGTEDFGCGTVYSNLGTTGATMTPTDLRLFVSNVALVDAEGNEVPVTLDVRSPWQADGTALLDFEDGSGRCSNGTAEVNSTVTGRVAPGTYTGVVFTNAVPFEPNHANPATSPPPLGAGGMTWTWLSGHLFIKAEMTAHADAGDDAGPGRALFHLGSTGCTNSPDAGNDNNPQAPATSCKAPNRNRVKLANFDAATKTIVLDVKELFADSDLSVASTCHSMMSAACGPLFENAGLDYTDAGGILNDVPIFRVE